VSARLRDAFDWLVFTFYWTRYSVWHGLPPVKRLDQERREEGRRAFELGRDIERQELGLPPKYSEYFIGEPLDLRAV
jgi:hypothetical protein